MLGHPSLVPDGLTVASWNFCHLDVALSQVAWLRAQHDAHLVPCSSWTSAASLGAEQRPRGRKAHPSHTAGGL